MVRIPEPYVAPAATNEVEYLAVVGVVRSFLNCGLRDAVELVKLNFADTNKITSGELGRFLRDCAFEDLYRDRQDNPIQSKRPRG